MSNDPRILGFTPDERATLTPEQQARADRRERKLARKIRSLRLYITTEQKTTELRRLQAHRQLVAIAHDLLPAAAGFARKGRPRLLAVVAKIIGDEKLDPIKFVG